MPYKSLSFFFTLLSMSFLPFLTHAAVLYFEPNDGIYYPGDIFIAEVKLNTEGESINTSELNISVDSGKLEIMEVSDGGSIFSFWPKMPAFSATDGKISFIGGVPNGFSGNGKLVSLVVRAKSPGFSQIIFQNDSKVLLNDGLGTPAGLNMEVARFQILAGEPAEIKDEWREKIKNDDILPEPFDIEVAKIEKRYFIIFSTVDNQTGIDHYEIKEGNKDWRVGESPYLLEDQSLKNKISVKAVDKAGNARISEIMPRRILYILLIIIFLLILGILIWRISKKR